MSDDMSTKVELVISDKVTVRCEGLYSIEVNPVVEVPMLKLDNGRQLILTEQGILDLRDAKYDDDGEVFPTHTGYVSWDEMLQLIDLLRAGKFDPEQEAEMAIGGFRD